MKNRKQRIVSKLPEIKKSVGLVIGPAVYGFLLAFCRTKLRLKEEQKQIQMEQNTEMKNRSKANK